MMVKYNNLTYNFTKVVFFTIDSLYNTSPVTMRFHVAYYDIMFNGLMKHHYTQIL